MKKSDFKINTKDIVTELKKISRDYSHLILSNIQVYNRHHKTNLFSTGVKPFKLFTFQYLLTKRKGVKPSDNDFRDKIIFCSEIGLLVGPEEIGFFNKEFYQSISYEKLKESIDLDFNERSLKIFGSRFELLKKPSTEELKMIGEITKVNSKLLSFYKKEEEKRLSELKTIQGNVLKELDEDGNGIVDVVEGNDFDLLFKKHENLIKDIDKKHIQEFVKISSYLKTKKRNIQKIFNSIKETENKQTLERFVQILKDDIHTYNLVLFNSLNLVISLIEDDTITFYEIYERFDNLNIFDSKHERDVSQKLTNIGDGIKDLMSVIENVGFEIVDQLSELNYMNEKTNRNLEVQLESINSSIDTNNLITSINTYQTYKLRNK